MFGNSVRCFLLTAETLSFSETARRLGISQQAVSKAVSRLEEKLELPLFSRSHRTLQLTPFGASCYTLLKETSNYLQKNLDDLRAQAVHSPRTLFVGYQNYVEITGLLAPGISQIRETNSSLNVVCERYSPASLVDGLLSCKLDIALLCQRFLPKNFRLRITPLTRLPLLLLFSSTFSLTGHDLASLRKAPLIIDRLENESASALETRAQREAALVGLEPERIVVTPNRDSAYAAAEMGLGVILCTSVSRFISLPGVKVCDTGVSDHLVCCWHSQMSSPLSEEFAQILQNVAATLYGE